MSTPHEVLQAHQKRLAEVRIYQATVQMVAEHLQEMQDSVDRASVEYRAYEAMLQVIIGLPLVPSPKED